MVLENCTLSPELISTRHMAPDIEIRPVTFCLFHACQAKILSTSAVPVGLQVQGNMFMYVYDGKNIQSLAAHSIHRH